MSLLRPPLPPSAPCQRLMPASASREPRHIQYRSMPRRVVAPGRSCLECRRRKIRCDRSQPCAYCVRIKASCEYPPSVPTKQAENDENSGLAARLESIEGALRALEHGHPGTHHLSHIALAQPANIQSRPSFSFPFNLDPSSLPALVHPSSATVLFIWQTYLDVVDPGLKIFHVPTIQRLVVQAIQCSSKLEPSTECLVFAIYYSTVVTMAAPTCRDRFHEDKSNLLSRYV